MKLLKVGLITLVGAYALVTLLVYLAQRELMFAPSLVRVLPADVGAADIQEVTLLNAAQHKLYSWYAAAAPNRPTLLYFHGNGGSVGTRKEKFDQLQAKGFGVFMLGYPGYGGSDGSPSEAAFVEAAELAYQYLLAAQVGPGDIVIYGESLGSAVAVQLAARQTAGALVLSAPMYSVQAMAQQQYPFLPVALLLKDPFLSFEYLSQVRVPTLVVHGAEDTVIPIARGRKLFAAANEPKTFHEVKGGGHNNLFDFQMVDIVDAFLAKHGVGG